MLSMSGYQAKSPLLASVSIFHAHCRTLGSDVAMRKPLRTKRSDHSHNVENVCTPSKSSYASITSLVMSVVIEPKNTPTRQTRNNSEIAVSRSASGKKHRHVS